AELGRFHKKIFDVVEEIKSVDLAVDKVHHEFLFKELGDSHKEQLRSLRERFKPASVEHYFIKEAGIMDFFKNFSRRGRALRAWEKRYPKLAGEFRNKTSSMLIKSENLLNI